MAKRKFILPTFDEPYVSALTMIPPPNGGSAIWFKCESTVLKANGTVLRNNGTWNGSYGQAGCVVVGSIWAGYAYSSLPSWCASVVPAGQSNYTWATTTPQLRAVQKPDNLSDRIAACWYNTTPFTITVDITDNKLHYVSMYFLDWDSARVQTIEAKRFSDGVVLESTTISNFNTTGKWLTWQLSSKTVFTITLGSGANAVVSGVFFDEIDFPRSVRTSLSY